MMPAPRGRSTQDLEVALFETAAGCARPDRGVEDWCSRTTHPIGLAGERWHFGNGCRLVHFSSGIGVWISATVDARSPQGAYPHACHELSFVHASGVNFFLSRTAGDSVRVKSTTSFPG